MSFGVGLVDPDVGFFEERQFFFLTHHQHTNGQRNSKLPGKLPPITHPTAKARSTTDVSLTKPPEQVHNTLPIVLFGPAEIVVDTSRVHDQAAEMKPIFASHVTSRS